MPNIPADVVGQAASTAATATQNAANMTQAPQSQWHDVWTQTGAGLLSPPAVSPFIPAPGETMTPEVAARIEQARESAAQLGHTNLDGLADGMSQQAGVVADQAAQLWDGKLPDGTSMSTLQRVGAAFGILSSIEQLITMPLGAIPFPAFPALRVTDMDVGLPHAHMHPPNLIPPNPVPVPLPSTGPVIPIPFVSGASKTLINMMPAARCGDMGLGVFCGGFFPMYEVFLGSANVWIEGSRAGRMGIDVTKHCIFSNPANVSKLDIPIGAMFGATVMGSANVMIGGVPLPSLTSMAIGAAFKAAFKGVGRVLGAARKRAGRAATAADNVPARPAPASSAAHAAGPPPVPHMNVPAIHSPQVAALVNSVAPGGRQVISEIGAGELRALTAATGNEWAVVVQADGRLALVHGTPTHVPLQNSDHLLIHTHPPGSPAIPSSPGNSMAPNGGNDLDAAAWDRANHNWDHPQAVVGQDGNVRFYNEHGVINNPNSQYLPIDNDGNISGVHHYGGDPNVPMRAIPPRM